MKLQLKHFLIVLCAIITIPLQSRAQSKDTSKVNLSTVYHDVKNGVDINAPKIEKAIGTIAKDLKVTVDKVWDILVKQQRVWSYCFLLLTLSALTNWYFFYKNNFIKLSKDNWEIGKSIRKVFNPNYDKSYDSRYQSDPRAKQYLEETEDEIIIPKFPENTMWFFKYLHLGICLTLSVFSYLHFASMLTGFMNPEFGAMQTIAQVAQSVK